MFEFRVRRDHLDLPDSDAQVHPELFVRVVDHDNGVILENTSLEHLPVEKDPSTGNEIRRALILRNVKSDPGNKDYILCTVDEITVARV